MTSKAPAKPKQTKKSQATIAEIVARNNVFVHPTKLKRTIIWDKVTGRKVDVTPERVKAMLPKRTKRPIGAPMIAPPGNYPMTMDAISVHPKQIAALRALMERKRLPGEVLPDGRIKLDSAADRKAHCEGRGFGDRNGGFRDPQFRRS